LIACREIPEGDETKQKPSELWIGDYRYGPSDDDIHKSCNGELQHVERYVPADGL
jgi:hypothetical protein